MNSILLTVAIVLVLAFFLCRFLGNSNIPSISADELSQLRKDYPNLEIIDVRTPGEIAGGKIKGAHEINYLSSDFGIHVSVLPKDKPYLVYCRSGRRSAGACSQMLKQGFKEVYNLQGGFRS